MSVHISSPDEYAKLLDKYDTWLFDCDGVLWRGDHLIEGVTEVLDMLRRRSMFAVFQGAWSIFHLDFLSK